MKNRIPASLKLLCFLFMFAISCKPSPDEIIKPHDSPAISCDPDILYFNIELLPTLASSGGKPNCHDATTHDKSVILTDLNKVLQAEGIEPFYPAGSKLILIVTGNGKEVMMPPPPDFTLTTDQIQMVNNWISQGAENVRCDNLSCNTVNITFTSSAWPVIQDNCKRCPSGAYVGGGIQLVDYSTLKVAADSGQLYGAIIHGSAYSLMQNICIDATPILYYSG